MKERGKIALMSGSYLPCIGGTEISLHNIAERLAKKGHKVVLIVPFSSFIYTFFHYNKFTYSIIPFLPKIKDFMKWNEKISFLVSFIYLKILDLIFSFDVFHITGAAPEGILYSHYCYRANKPFLIRAVGYDIQVDEDINYGARLDKKIDILLKAWIKKANRLIATTQTVHNGYIQLGVRNEKIIDIPNGVDTKRFKINVNREETKKMYGINSNQFLFLCVGRNHPKKGFKYLLDAVLLLKNWKLDNFVVAMIGKDMNILRNQAREMRISNYFKFINPITENFKYKKNFDLPADELVRLYKSADCFVFPSLLETFGIVLIEAMAAGLPIITTNSPGCRDVVKNKENGLVVPSADPKALAMAMIELLNDEKKRILFSERNTKAVISYDWDSIVDSYLIEYTSLIEH